MELEDLRLTKEEIPILHEACFQVPIHHKLLDPTLSIEPNIASRIFERTALEWYQDLEQYRKTADLDKETKEWYDNVWLRELPRIEIQYGSQIMVPGHWTDEHINQDNGLTRCFSISRDSGGSLHFPGLTDECKSCLSIIRKNKGYIRFSPEKAKEFGFNEYISLKEKFTNVNIYGHHNIDYYPGALFLRNWAINYMNEALKFVAD